MRTTQHPIRPATDLRDMLRQHLIERSLACMQAAAARRRAALETGDIATYRQAIRKAVRGFYGKPPARPQPYTVDRRPRRSRPVCADWASCARR